MCRHFFELVRFDFVIDSDLKVWLMEVIIFIISDQAYKNRAYLHKLHMFLINIVISYKSPTELA